MIDRRNFSKTFMATLGSLAVTNPLFSNDLLDDFKKSNPKNGLVVGTGFEPLTLRLQPENIKINDLQAGSLVKPKT